ncbi:hypothetical protein HPB50_004968 [Hyalomma asiaticum]|uniref:Uncharacterized protein n=1 Tax=Hyalomma asiaticum TaxID=266040 RepID=A0ACB7TFD6_HYAAI|nr:hypothetical protein HPB50_004968 [Hyalomma asiaticum]
MKERLMHEASLLSHKPHMASLIIDEASIKPKCIYDRKSDTVFGIRDKPENTASCSKNETLANRVLCFVLHGITTSYKIPCSYYFTKQLNGRDLYAWTKDVIAAVEDCGFVIIRIATDNYSANTMFKLMGNGSLSTVVKHPHDIERIIFLSFDPCHVLKNVRSQFLEREFTDGTGLITGTLVQKLYEHQKGMTVKLARNLTRKRVYPSNLEKMNDSSVAACIGSFTDETYTALLFTAKSTVETVRFLLKQGVNYVLTKKFNSDPIEALFGKFRAMCGGNDALDARAVTTALTHIVKEKALPSKVADIRDENVEEAARSEEPGEVQGGRGPEVPGASVWATGWIKGRLAVSSRTQRCSRFGRGPLVPDCRELCLVVSRVKRGKPSAELPHRSHGAVLAGTAMCNRHAWVFNEAPEAEVEPALFQASPGRRYCAEERETWSTGLLSPVSVPACRGVPCDDSYTNSHTDPEPHLGYEAEKKIRDMRGQGLTSEAEDSFRERCAKFHRHLFMELKLRLPDNINIMRQTALLSPGNTLKVIKESLIPLMELFGRWTGLAVTADGGPAALQAAKAEGLPVNACTAAPVPGGVSNKYL